MRGQVQGSTPDPFVEKVLAREIAEQCGFALMASEELVRIHEDYWSYPIERIWYVLQNFLIATANISKLLWGTKAEIENRRADLRRKLEVDDTFTIKDRSLRNDFEHFDERVEERCSTNHQFTGRNIGPREMFDLGRQEDHFQEYDPETGQLTFWAHSISVPDLLQEVQFLLPRAQAIGSGRQRGGPAGPDAYRMGDPQLP